MYSYESRLPYVDYRLVEFVVNLPECYKLHNGYTKYIARKAFDSKLSDNIVWDKNKIGYTSASEYYYNIGRFSFTKNNNSKDYNLTQQ
jgi:asparagine synthase (glutamine-hydrolysing)